MTTSLQGADMTNALESGREGKTIARKPHRRSQQPHLLLTLGPDLDRDVMTIIRAIKWNRRRCGCGTHLFIEPDMSVYVITEQQSIVHEWIRTRFAAYVGMYLPVARQKGLDAPLGVAPGMTATYDGLREDVGEHLRLMGLTA